MSKKVKRISVMLTMKDGGLHVVLCFFSFNERTGNCLSVIRSSFLFVPEMDVGVDRRSD